MRDAGPTTSDETSGRRSRPGDVAREALRRATARGALPGPAREHHRHRTAPLSPAGPLSTVSPVSPVKARSLRRAGPGCPPRRKTLRPAAPATSHGRRCVPRVMTRSRGSERPGPGESGPHAVRPVRAAPIPGSDRAHRARATRGATGPGSSGSSSPAPSYFLRMTRRIFLRTRFPRTRPRETKRGTRPRRTPRPRPRRTPRTRCGAAGRRRRQTVVPTGARPSPVPPSPPPAR